MHRTVVVTYTQTEREALKECRLRAAWRAEARGKHEDAVRRAVKLGLPVRVVGEAAKLSGAQVSRLTSKG